MEVRGSILQSVCDFMVDRYGEGNYRHWLSVLAPESRKHFETRIGANSWYPMREALLEPVQLLLNTYYGGLPAGARALGFYNAEKALSGFLKFVVRRGTPAFIIRQASSILERYYLPCVSEVPMNEKRHAVVRVTRFDEPSLIVDYRIQGWMERALEVSGCENIRVSISRSMARGDNVTEFEGTWD